MEDYFSQIQNQPTAQTSRHSIEQPQQPIQAQQFIFTSSSPNVGVGSQHSTQPRGSANSFNIQNNDNEFNDFQEDQTTKRIREQQERVHQRLKQKSLIQKGKRRQEGGRQLQQFLQNKRKQKKQRSEENIRKQQDAKKEYAAINKEAGWKKVVTNVNLKQGQYKGKKDVNRMREAILHRREDDPR